MLSGGSKTILSFLVVFGLVFHHCRSDDGKNPDEQESEETFETHLWSRLSKDHSSRDKRESEDFSDDDDPISASKWRIGENLRKGRNLLSVAENDPRPPPSFEKVRICFLDLNECITTC
jgi:hypothetical protein